MKRKPLTKTRAEAVTHFATALKRYNGLCQNFDMTTFLKDYKSGVNLDLGQYKLTREQKASSKVGKKKTPLWKLMLGYD